MHNLKDLRKNLDNYKKKFKDRNVIFDDKKFIEKDDLNRGLISKKEKLEQEKKLLSKSKNKSNFERSKKISEEISKISKNQLISQKNINNVLNIMPNLALDDVPVGKDENSNKLISQNGNIRKFSFK